MNTIFSKAIFGFCTLAISFGYANLSYADTDTQNLIGGYGSSNAAFQILVRSPNDGPLIIAQDNSQLLYVPFPANPSGIEQTLMSLSKLFVPITQQNITPDDLKTTNTVTFGPPGTPISSQKPNYFVPPDAKSERDKNQGQMAPFTNVDINSVLGPLVYDKDQQKTAENFINAATSISSPLQTVDLTEQARKAEDSSVTATTLATTPNTDIARYLAALRLYAAMQAVGMSNLYQLYAERLPSYVPDDEANKTLTAALKGINMPNASQLQVENYMATRRLTDPKWVASLANDSPAALLRQIAVLQAENLLELYNVRIAQERLTAAMSMLVLQGATTSRAMVETQASNINSGKKMPTSPTS